MKFTSSALLATCLVFGSKAVEGAQCNADNCLRALFPTGTPSAVSSALAFCATYTTTINTATTGFPTRATGGCGTATARYSSACSCKPTNTPTCTPTPANNLVKNGGFECGLAPWVAADVANTQHKLSSPGDASATAYEFDQVGNPSADSNMNPASVNQDVSGFTVGTAYTLSFSAYFDKCTTQEGFIGVKINQQPVFTFDACDQGQQAVGKFFRVTVPSFTATSPTENIRFEFLTGEAREVVKLDNVVITPA